MGNTPSSGGGTTSTASSFTKQEGNFLTSTFTTETRKSDGSKVVEQQERICNVPSTKTTTTYDNEGSKTKTHYESSTGEEAWTTHYNDGSSSQVVQTESTITVWEISNEGKKELVDLTPTMTVDELQKD